MPYEIRKNGRGQFCVAKQADGSIIPGGCHRTRAEAAQQIAAIEASEAKRKQSAGQLLFGDGERCRRFNRIVALKDAVEAVPVHLFRSLADATAEQGAVLDSVGSLPESHEEELAAINAGLPEHQAPLTATQVYVHYVEAANGSYIEDRHMFLDAETTLQNLAGDAWRGIAFMNSHRTRSMSHPSELPYGRTFAGRYERYLDAEGQVRDRTLMGFYMLRGVFPNGESGPSTDDLHQGIEGGTLFDVSIGLAHGQEWLRCDVCHNPIDARDQESGERLCGHIPGTRRSMSPEQIDAQVRRGVAKGWATMTLVDGHAKEVSGVYDGAISGAGFRKLMALKHELDARTLEEARFAYGALLAPGDLPMGPTEERSITEAIASGFTRALRALGHRPRDEQEVEMIERYEEELGESPAAGARGTPKTVAETPAQIPPEFLARLERAEREVEVSQAARFTDWLEHVGREAEHFAEEQIQASRALPAEREVMVAFYRRAAIDDRKHPLARPEVFGSDQDGRPLTGSRLDLVRHVYTQRQPHALLRELARGEWPKDAAVLSSILTTDTEQAAMNDTRREELLKHSSTGRAVLKGNGKEGR